MQINGFRCAAVACFVTSSACRTVTPTTHYDVGPSPQDSSIFVWMQFGRAPRSVRLAMAVHPEYDDRFWRYITDWHVDGADRRALLTKDRDNIWRVISHAGGANITYRIQLPHENATYHPVWHTFIRADGGSINPIDTFLYLPDFPNARVIIELGVGVPVVWDGPRSRVIAFADGHPMQHFETDAATLLDSPFLYGSTLRFWGFEVDGVPHTIAYWPLPNAAQFDTVQFVDAIHKVVSEAIKLFGAPPYKHYNFLLEDGAYGALEHANSVTIGMPSADLARDPHAYLSELAHEFFHAWNLVRLYPEGRGTLSADPPAHSTGLWFSEGVTMYYAEALTRRAGFAERGLPRTDLLAEELESYYNNPGNSQISPELASAREVDTTGINGDYEPNYYVQGRLIGTALDLLIRDSTHDRKSLDDLMRAMYARFALKRGFTSADVERAASETCACDLHSFFEQHVRNSRPLDFTPVLSSIGYRVLVDTIPATDTTGAPLADVRVWAYPPRSGGRMRIMIQNPASVWARAGLHTGMELVSFNGVAIDSFPDFRRALRPVKLGDSVPVDVVLDGAVKRVNVKVTGYTHGRVRIIDAVDLTPVERQRRTAWLRADP
jgi:predicted metalloprotease with PDZ domain